MHCSLESKIAGQVLERNSCSMRYHRKHNAQRKEAIHADEVKKASLQAKLAASKAESESLLRMSSAQEGDTKQKVQELQRLDKKTTQVKAAITKKSKEKAKIQAEVDKKKKVADKVEKTHATELQELEDKAAERQKAVALHLEQEKLLNERIDEAKVTPS
jgi:hypothetical protein